MRDAIRARLADLLGVGVNDVNIKATTTERLGFTGRGREGHRRAGASSLLVDA